MKGLLTKKRETADRRQSNRLIAAVGKIRFAATGFLLLCSQGLLMAQGPCDLILREGVFNQTTVNSQKSVQDNLYEWLKITVRTPCRRSSPGSEVRPMKAPTPSTRKNPEDA